MSNIVTYEARFNTDDFTRGAQNIFTQVNQMNQVFNQTNTFIGSLGGSFGNAVVKFSNLTNVVNNVRDAFASFSHGGGVLVVGREKNGVVRKAAYLKNLALSAVTVVSMMMVPGHSSKNWTVKSSSESTCCQWQASLGCLSVQWVRRFGKPCPLLE